MFERCCLPTNMFLAIEDEEVLSFGAFLLMVSEPLIEKHASSVYEAHSSISFYRASGRLKTL